MAEQTYAELDAAVTAAGEAYDAADQAILAAITRGAKRAELAALRAERDRLEEAHAAAIDARQAAWIAEQGARA